MCYKCEAVDDLSVDFKQRAKRTHVCSTDDFVGKFIYYLRQSRPFEDNICYIT